MPNAPWEVKDMQTVTIIALPKMLLAPRITLYLNYLPNICIIPLLSSEHCSRRNVEFITHKNTAP